MKSKQRVVNGAAWFFVLLIAVHLILYFVLRETEFYRNMTVVTNILLSQSAILIPTIIYIIVAKVDIKETLRIRKTHWAAIFLVPIWVVAIEPLTAVINSISMLWVENTTSNLAMSLVTNNKFIVSFLLMAVTPGIVEELAYRGVMLGSFRQKGPIVGILVSGLFFGLMHMNFNQMAYAVVIGIIFGLLVEVTGSILTTMYAHLCFNGVSVVLSYVLSHLQSSGNMPKVTGSTQLGKNDIMLVVAVMLPMAIVGLAVAFAIMYALAVLNKRDKYIFGLFKKNKATSEQQVYTVNQPAPGNQLSPDNQLESGNQPEKVKLISVPFIIGIVACIGFMILNEFVL